MGTAAFIFIPPRQDYKQGLGAFIRRRLGKAWRYVFNDEFVEMDRIRLKFFLEKQRNKLQNYTPGDIFTAVVQGMSNFDIV